MQREQRAAATSRHSHDRWRQEEKRPLEIPSEMFVLSSKDKENVNSVTPELRDIFHGSVCVSESEFMKDLTFPERRGDER